MNKRVIVGTLASAALLALAAGAGAQQTTMTFFLTSAGPGKGADLGGLEGADRHCQQLAQAAGAGGKTWRAYLSTQAAGGGQAVNARDRIGAGPWQQRQGRSRRARTSTTCTAPTTSSASRPRSARRARWSTAAATRPTGTTCSPARSPTAGRSRPARIAPAATGRRAAPAPPWSVITTGRGCAMTTPSKSWNSSHPSRGPDGGCSQADLKSTGGDGLFYCFATN